MLTIRLSRVGRKNDPSFRVIVVESKRKPQPGNYLEMVGSYNPKMNRTELNGERIKHWISNGATVSDTVHNLLVSQKVIDAKKINILPAFKAVPVIETPKEKVADVSDVASAESEASSEVKEEVSTPEVEETPAEVPAQTEDNAVAEDATQA